MDLLKPKRFHQIRRGQMVLPLLGDHISRSEQQCWGNQLVVGLGSHWAGVRAGARLILTDYSLMDPIVCPA